MVLKSRDLGIPIGKRRGGRELGLNAMTDISSNNYQHGYSSRELKRLGEQYQVWSKENLSFLKRAGFTTNQTVVDLGCGPGFTTLDLARIVGSGGKVIAVDRDGEYSLPLLEEQARTAGLTNIEIHACELAELELSPESVDGIYGRWVLMYLPEDHVKDIIFRMVSWLRPGGVCALAEFCNFLNIQIHPPTQYLMDVAKALMRNVSDERGCNPEIGTMLPCLIRKAGLKTEINVVTKVVQSGTAEWIWPDRLFRDVMPDLVGKGFLSKVAMEGFLQDWEKRSNNPEALFFGSPVMETIGRWE
jgi:ubiquinone/menaquinone biosynthesis C-methylase UbiE